MNEAREPGVRRSIAPSAWRRAFRIGLGVLAVLATLAFAAPYAAVAYGTKRAAACLAAYEGPRSADHPDCSGELRWFVTPSRLPWTRSAASYRGEELNARIAIADYLDAVVGHPNRDALARAAEALAAAEKIVKDGSQRLSMEDLGPAVSAPNLGRVADFAGDRATLLARADMWPDWHVRVHTLEAALIEGDLPRATALAKRYAEFDPRMEDLRTAVAALLCLGGDARRGIEMLTTVQNDRASKRYAAMARNWGAVRMIIVACAALGREPVPPKPEQPEAGQGDEQEMRAALRLRLASVDAVESGARYGVALDDAREQEREAVGAAMSLLTEGARSPGARAALLAAVMASSHAPDADKAADLARPRREEGEAPLLRSVAITALDWLDEPRGLSPVVHGSVLERAAERLLAMSQTRGTAQYTAETLRTAAGALWIEAGGAFARAGYGSDAIRSIERGGPLVLESEQAIALARSSAWYVTGDLESALAELDAMSAIAEPSSALAGARLVTAATQLQRAELLAALRVRQDADANPPSTEKEVTAAAIEADRTAAAAGDASLSARARFTRLALAREPDTAPLRPGSEIDPSAHRAWPWLGATELRGQLTGTKRSEDGGGSADDSPLSRALALWSTAREAPAKEQLAYRYALLRTRGDAPGALVPHMTLATQLLEGGQGDPEVWLDALYAIDARRFSYRMYTWARAQAARWCGDEPRAKLWTQRNELLRSIASDPARAELARYLGI